MPRPRKTICEDFLPDSGKPIKEFDPIELPDGTFPLSENDAKKAGLERSRIKLNKNNRFSLRLRELREKTKRTQQNVADRLGITKSAYGYYENGDSVPDAKTVYKMAELFGVSTDYLLFRTEVATPNLLHRKISEKTGLSEKAVGILIGNSPYIGVKRESAAKLLNTLFEDYSFWDTLDYIERLEKVEAYVLAENEAEAEAEGLLPEFDPHFDAFTPEGVSLSARQYKRFIIRTMQDEMKEHIKNGVERYLKEVNRG